MTAVTPGREELEPITMQDVRLAAGEGKLSCHDTLAAVNAILKSRADRLAAKPADEGWQDISTAPKDGTSFLSTMAGGTDGPYWVLFWNGEAFECVASGATGLISASHWRSVATPPSTTGAPKLDPPDNSLTDPSTMGEVE